MFTKIKNKKKSCAPNRRTIPSKVRMTGERAHDLLQISQHLCLVENQFLMSLKSGLNVRQLLTPSTSNLFSHLRSLFQVTFTLTTVIMQQCNRRRLIVHPSPKHRRRPDKAHYPTKTHSLSGLTERLHLYSS